MPHEVRGWNDTARVGRTVIRRGLIVLAVGAVVGYIALAIWADRFLRDIAALFGFGR